MCWTCFREYGHKPVINEKVLSVYRKMMNEDIDYSTLLHVIVADMNVEDYQFENEDIKQDYLKAQNWERDIFDHLYRLSEAERLTAVAMEWGYINPGGTLLEGCTLD